MIKRLTTFVLILCFSILFSECKDNNKYNLDLTQYTEINFSMKPEDVISYENKIYNNSSYTETSGKVGHNLNFNDETHMYTFSHDDNHLFQAEYTFYDENIYHDLTSELTELFGESNGDYENFWYGNINGVPAAIWIIETTDSHVEFEKCVLSIFEVTDK